jgi:hypothetical protein
MGARRGAWPAHGWIVDEDEQGTEQTPLIVAKVRWTSPDI